MLIEGFWAHVDPRGIDENNLEILFVENARDIIAGSLGAMGDDGDLLAKKSIKQSALAGVWTA